MITVPLAAISAPDDKGESVAPEVGDTVDLGGATAKVISVDGDSVELSMESINGTPIKADDPESDEPGPEDSAEVDDPRTGEPMSADGAKLMRSAAKADRLRGY